MANASQPISAFIGKKNPSFLLNLFYIFKKSNPFVFSFFFFFLHFVFVFIFMFSLKLNKIYIKTVIILTKINDKGKQFFFKKIIILSML